MFADFQIVPHASVTAHKIAANFVQTKSFVREYHDVVVVMDGSGSVGSCEFKKGKKALYYLLGMKHEKADLKFAAVTFSNSARVNFKFLPFSSGASELQKVSYPSGMTNTQAGLTEAKKLFDDPSSGKFLYYNLSSD